MQNTSYLLVCWFLENMTKRYICFFFKFLAILVVLFSLEQKQRKQNACGDKLAFSVDYMLGERNISYTIAHRCRVVFLVVEHNM